MNAFDNTSTTIHILNGDALKEQLTNLEAEKIVFRECLIEGPVRKHLSEKFVDERRTYLDATYGSVMQGMDISEQLWFSKFKGVDTESDLALWFEHDLFCQVNLWFILHHFHNSRHKGLIRLVSPQHQEWSGFGSMTEDQLIECFNNHIVLNEEQIKDYALLWDSYVDFHWDEMRDVAKSLSTINENIVNVVEAHIARFPTIGGHGKPKQTLMEIIKRNASGEFGEVFKEFSKEAGIYGFGDLQVKRLLNELDI